jgi:integrase
VATVERRKSASGVSWYVRWRDPDGRQRAKAFRKKLVADRFRGEVEQRLSGGDYLDPAAGRATVGEWASSWLTTQSHLKPTTRARYEGVLNKHVLPRWGRTPLAKVRHTEVATWVADLTDAGCGPSTVAYAYRVLSLMLDLAVRDARIPRNPALGVKLPRARTGDKRYLSHEQVAALADAAGNQRLVVLTLAFCGLRWGELAALKVRRLNLDRRRLEVAESVTEVRGQLVWGSPKSHQRRSVAIPQFLADELRQHVAGKAADDLVFATQRGRVLRNRNFRRDHFDHAAAAAGLDGLTPHELRHTAASLAVSAGANVKAVQRMLGHASAAMTLDVYSGLFEDDIDQVAERLNAQAGVYGMCTPSGAEAWQEPPTSL